MTLNHVHIGTKDLQRSVEFYSSLFGFKKKFDHAPGIFLHNQNGFLLAIDSVDEVPAFPSWFHLGFCLASEGEVEGVYAKAKSMNVRIVREMIAEKDEFASFYVCDPDGYRIEVSWHRE